MQTYKLPPDNEVEYPEYNGDSESIKLRTVAQMADVTPQKPPTHRTTARLDRLVTAGNSDPAGPPVHENNVWLVGDDSEVIVIDPAHDAAAVADAVGGRRVVDVLLTHGHWDHIRAALDFSALVGARVWLNSADDFLWQREHGHDDVSQGSYETGESVLRAPRTRRYEPIADGQVFVVAGLLLEARFTPGHTPGSTSFVAPALGAVFSGDTLFEGGPGATRWEYSSFDTIIESITERLLTLPDDTEVHTGHGPSTTVGTERADRETWIARGW